MDAALIKIARSGNDHAFRLLVEKYQLHVYKSVYAVLRNQKDAEDASQEVLLKIYTSLPRYENQGFKTWITRIAMNHAIDMKRKHSRRREDMESAMHSTNLKASHTENNYPKMLAKANIGWLLFVRKRQCGYS